jgi:hypothetical protein
VITQAPSPGRAVRDRHAAVAVGARLEYELRRLFEPRGAGEP